MQTLRIMILLAFVCLIVVPPADPASLMASTSTQETLIVAYQRGLLSVTAENVPLAQILQEVARQTEIDVQGSEGLQAKVSMNFTELPLRDGLRKLLVRNYIIVETGSPQEYSRPMRVLVVGRQTTSSPETIPPQEGTTLEGAMSTLEDHETSMAAELTDPDPSIRQWAVERLGEQGGEQSWARLVDLLNDEEPAIRQEALAALSQYGEDAIEPMRALLEREASASVRAAALQMLGQVGREKTSDLLWGSLADPEPQVRLAAVEALGFAASPIALEALQQAASDSELAIRMVALRTLALYHRENGVEEILEQGLSDAHEEIREMAAELLATFVESQNP